MTKIRKIGLAVVAVLCLLGVTGVVLPSLLWGDGVDYSTVKGIDAHTREYQDTGLLAKAWTLPVARLYQPDLDYQSNGSFCGPTSVVNVMRSLGMPANQSSILDGSEITTVFGRVPGGITLDELANLARSRLGKNVTVLRDLDLAGFREHLQRANDPSRRYVINFHRGPLFGRGGGHHSPIAGYLSDEDLVFVLDVNETYQPWLVSSERLYQAMSTVDAASELQRGLLLIE